MKNLVLLSLIVMFGCFDCYAKNGSFLVTKSTYLYEVKNKSGKKTLTRVKRAYDVVSVYDAHEESLMFQIEVPKENNVVNGTGFIVETEEELKALGISRIKVYSDIPTLDKDLTQYQLVQSNELSFTGRQESSPDFPNLLWRSVNYKTVMPLRVWVPEWAGIYRPDKDAAWLNNTHEQTLFKKLERELATKIIMGQIETGFSKEQVKMALGEPLEVHPSDDNKKLEWIYNNHKVIFENNVVLRVL